MVSHPMAGRLSYQWSVRCEFHSSPTQSRQFLCKSLVANSWLSFFLHPGELHAYGRYVRFGFEVELSLEFVWAVSTVILPQLALQATCESHAYGLRNFELN